MGDQLAKFDILNYSTTLIGWTQSDPIPSGITFNGGDSLYQAAQNAYTNLTTTYQWTFVPVPFFIPTPALAVEYNEPTTQDLIRAKPMLAYQPVFLSQYTDLVFTVAPPLPAGLALNRLTGIINGTPTVLANKQSYTVTTTANNGTVQVENTLTFAVINVVSYSSAVYTFVVGTLGTPIEPTVAPGFTITTYALSPALPAGLIFDTTFGTITGTPAAAEKTAAYTITAVYDGVPYANTLYLNVITPGTATFDILNYSTTLIGWVQSSPIPSGITFNGGDSLYQAAFDAYTLLTQTYQWTFVPVPFFIPTPALAVEYNEPTTQDLIRAKPMLAYQPVFLSLYTDLVFTVAPPLPAGLALNRLTGIINGTPTVLTDKQSYSVTTTANNGTAQVVNTLTFAVINVVAYSPTVYTFVAGTLITPITPTVAPGFTIATYALTPALPKGLDFDTTLGTITGTPTSQMNAVSYTITAVYDGAPYVNTVSITIKPNTIPPFLLQFTNVPVYFKVTLPFFGLYSDSTIEVDWGDGTPLTTNILTYNYSNSTIVNYTVKVYIVSGTVSNFGFRNWQGSANLTAIADWANLPGLTRLNYIGGAALTSVPDSLPPTVTDLSFLFEGASSFNQDLRSWDVSKITDMSSMFRDASAFNKPLNTWNVGQVTNMASMFTRCTNFDQPLNKWNVSKVVSMSFLFYRVKNFNQDLSAWNVSRVVDMRSVFSEASSFNQDISNWDVSSATQMSYMFYQSSRFNQNLSKWNVSKVATMDYMFTDATSFDALNYSTTLIGWASLPTLQKNVPLSGGTTLYQAALAAYNKLTNIQTLYWKITPVPNFLTTPALIVQYNEATTRHYINNTTILPYQPSFLSIYADVVFSITPALPAGLVIDTANGTISGTPRVFSPQIAYTVKTSANKGQLSVKNTIILSVDNPNVSNFYYDPAVYTFLNDIQIIPVQPILAADIPMTGYTISPTLPSDLKFNTLNGAITGTPTTAALNQAYTITGTNFDKTTATYPITLSIADISYANVPYLYAQNAEFLYSPFNGKPIIPTRYDSALFESIVLTTPLPVELAIDLSDGIIYGIPYTATPTKNYILNATTLSGYTKDIPLNITVNGFSYTEDGSEPVYTLKINDTVKITVLINVGGYTDFISYPKLPAGLSLDSATGTIFGTVRAQNPSTEVYFISGLVYPIITIPITIIIEANNNYPPVCEYKCPPRVIVPLSRETINTNAMRYSTIVRTGLGQTRFIANSGTNINDAYTQPIRNKF
jgi:surface protein